MGHAYLINFIIKYFMFYVLMRNVNECSKSIGLKTIFRNILWKNDKTINFLTTFYISHESGI